MSPVKKHSILHRDHPSLSFSQQCKLAQLSLTAFYCTSTEIDTGTHVMMKEIDRVFTQNPFLSSRQIAAYLRRAGTVIGRHRVRRLMAKMGLGAIYKRPKTSQPNPRHPVYSYLLRKMHIRAEKIDAGFESILRSMTPSKNMLDIAMSMLKTAWDQRGDQAKQAKAEIKRQHKELDKQQDALVERMVETTNPKVMAALETKIAKLEEDKLLLTDKLSQNTKPKSTLSEIIELLRDFLSSP